jgi:flagellar biosynthetic protein FliP
MGIVFAFGLVFALLGLSLRLLQRFGPGTVSGPGRVRMELVQRIALSPKQGIAVVRIGDRVLAVSTGEGGVRPLAELEEEELESAPAAPALRPLIPQAFPAQLRALLRTATRTAAGVALALALGVAAPAAAQQPAPQAAAAQARTPTASFVEQMDRQLPRVAPQMNLQVGQGSEGLRLSGTVGIVVMMGLLTMLPTLLLMMTSFTRVLIVLHFLRQALGTQSAPPGHLMAALALLLTGFIMAPTLNEVNQQALQPWLNGQIEQGRMLTTAAVPMREFMLAQTRESDLNTFLEISSRPSVSSVEEIPLVVIMSAFVTSELRSAFQIGFALFLPFIVIDVVVASVLMSMGMMMLPPAMIALPFKLLLFVLVDGWSLIVQGLVSSFH